MNLHQKRLLLLFGIFLTLSGTCGMLFGDPLLAGRISTLFAGIGMAISLAQFFLPLEPPRDDTAQTSGLILPSSYLQKRQPQKVDLILPFSYYYSLQRRQKQQKVNRNRVTMNIIIIITVSIPIVVIILLYISQNRSTPIDISNSSDATTSRSIQIIQDYCHAMIRQNYSAAYNSSGVVEIGGEIIRGVNTFTQKARQADQRGYLTNCTVKSGRKYFPLPSGSYSPASRYDYDFTVEVKRSSGLAYFTHISVSISYGSFGIDRSIGIDRL